MLVLCAVSTLEPLCRRRASTPLPLSKKSIPRLRDNPPIFCTHRPLIFTPVHGKTNAALPTPTPTLTTDTHRRTTTPNNADATDLTAGTTCETGYKKLDPAHLQPNLNMEFSEATGKSVPGLSDYRISVMYTLSDSDGADAASMAVFEASLSSVVEHFPDAFEVVLVTAGRHKYLFDGAVKKVASYAPYAVRLVTDEAAAAAPLPGDSAEAAEARERSRRRLTADEFCLGDYVLHVEPKDVLFRQVTYDVVFRFEKPVVPYGRHPEGECGFLSERGWSVLVLPERT